MFLFYIYFFFNLLVTFFLNKEILLFFFKVYLLKLNLNFLIMDPFDIRIQKMRFDINEIKNEISYIQKVNF